MSFVSKKLVRGVFDICKEVGVCITHILNPSAHQINAVFCEAPPPEFSVLEAYGISQEAGRADA